MERSLVCSFCQKTEHQVSKLVAGPSVFICDECVAVAARIMREADTGALRGWRRVAERVRAALDALRQRIQRRAIRV